MRFDRQDITSSRGIPRALPIRFLCLILLISACGPEGESINRRQQKSNADQEKSAASAKKIDKTTKVPKRNCELGSKFGISGDGVTDDTEAIKRALASNKELFLCPGTYLVSDTIPLRSGTKLHGEGLGSKILFLPKTASHIFSALGDDSQVIENVTISNLAFSTPEPVSGYVLYVHRGSQIEFSRNSVDNIGLVHTHSHLKINVWDQTPDPSATAGQTADTQLSQYVRILDNKASSELPQNTNGIHLGFVRDVVVRGNTLNGYRNAIMWWGGDANPKRGGALENPRWAKNLQITNNTVVQTVAGIWGSMGQDILVNKNYVEHCADVCLDAEGSFRVKFIENTGKNAINGVLGVFFSSVDVLFEKNTVLQDGSLGNAMFFTSNPGQQPGKISIEVVRNTFRYIGNQGFGVVKKSSSNLFAFRNNVLHDTILSIGQNNAGTIVVTGNDFLLNRPMPNEAPAVIAAGRNHRASALISGNTITATVPQLIPGIYVHQDDFNSSVTSEITGNIIAGFPRSIEVLGNSSNPGRVMNYTISNNQTTGAIADLSPAGRSVTTLSGNMPL